MNAGPAWSFQYGELDAFKKLKWFFYDKSNFLDRGLLNGVVCDISGLPVGLWTMIITTQQVVNFSGTRNALLL